MIKDRLPALRAACTRRQDSFFDFQPSSEQHEKIPLNSEYQLLIDCEYLHDFLKEAKIVWEDINWLKSKVVEVKKKQNFILSQPNMKEETRREVEDTISSIKKVAHKVKTKLKEFEIEIERARKENPTSAKPRIRQMQYDSLSRYYIEVMFECNAIQIEHRERCKERLRRQLEIARRSATTDDQLEDMLEQGNPVIFAEIECINTKEAQIMLADIAARHEAILKLEQSIMELHSMFMDMAILVQNQGELINQIYHNVVKASDFVATGTKYTKRAFKLQKSIRWKKVVIGLVVSAVLIIIIGAVVGSLRKK